MTVAIIQARLTSTRLPNKVLMQLGKYTAIELMYERVKRSKLLSNIVFAIPDNSENDKLESYISSTLKAPLIRGSENNVLSRYCKAAEIYPCMSYVRLTADCPFICPEIIDLVVNKGREEGLDYCSNTNPSTFPDGFDTEYLTNQTLEWLNSNMKTASFREHVTLGLKYKKQHKPDLKTGCILNIMGDQSRIRLTLDHPEDLAVLKFIAEACSSPVHAKSTEVIDIYKQQALDKINGRFVIS